MKYIVPDFYLSFHCKCGECRHSCCEGWPVRISKKEYYRLLGVNCTKRLRTKLDCTLKLCPSPSEECYAEISSDWRGLCRMHREDGLCELQVELGEDNLPEVCRRYPRSTRRISDTLHSTCSNSCEKVIELLIEQKMLIQFTEVDLPLKPESEITFKPELSSLCSQSIQILQNRSMRLPERFLALADSCFGNPMGNKRPDQLSEAFQFLHLCNSYYESSDNLNGFCGAAKAYYHMGEAGTLSAELLEDIISRYHSASDHMELLMPDWQILFEQLLVNYMLYSGYPYISISEHTVDAYLSLVIIYAFLRFHVVRYMADKAGSDQPTEVLAALFRVICHSNFNQVTARLIRSLHSSLQDCMLQLIFL